VRQREAPFDTAGVIAHLEIRRPGPAGAFVGLHRAFIVSDDPQFEVLSRLQCLTSNEIEKSPRDALPPQPRVDGEIQDLDGE